MRFASVLTRKERRRELSLAQLVALARYTRELLQQPLWSCMKIFQTLINYPKIKFSDHKAAAGAVRRRRKRQVAAGCKPASAWSAVFSKGVQSRKKTSIIYTKNHHFDNTFNPIENIYSFCIRSKNITRVSKNHAQNTQNPIQTAAENPITTHRKILF